MSKQETLEQKRDRILRELAEEGERVLTQDNRFTAHPVFCVQQEHRVYLGDQSDDSDGYEVRRSEDWGLISDHPGQFFDDDDDGDDDLDSDEEDAPSNTRRSRHNKVYYKKVWEDVAVFFTEVGADLHVYQNAHNLNNPRVYVKSAYRNSEWIKLRELLATLGEIQRFQKACEAEEDHGDPPPLHGVGDG